ncbi:Alpha/Beta hydrolase protein [Sordaria brevicollis]|uniref:Alpha/Beta hydrolase protein n=1 Tax=Sordaria brevicollis TaxID=83679 RepID=A0AAE0PN60_SORBR|nr:Alpha/Beta hydrolase protein [Sordaria brevicollis]
MADAEVATKSPESDALEDIPVAEFTPPPSKTIDSSSTSAAAPTPALCDNCTSDRPTPAGQKSTGEIIKLNDVDVYVSKPADYPHTSAKLLLLLTGGTGLHSVNNQIQADRFAQDGGFVVVMPDLFEGDPAPNSATALSPDELPGTGASTGSTAPTSSFLEIFKIKAAETAKSFLIDMWLARHTEDKIMPILKKVLEGVRDEFADAVAYGDGIYAAGYCIGGRYVLLLAREETHAPRKTSISERLGGITLPWAHKPAAPAVAPTDLSSSGESAQSGDDLEANRQNKTSGPWIKAGAIAHATLVSKEDFKGLKVPITMVSVENDPVFPDEVRMAGEDYMSKNNVEHEVQVYPGVPHGFAVVGEYEDAHIKEAQATAFEQMLKWLAGH